MVCSFQNVQFRDKALLIYTAWERTSYYQLNEFEKQKLRKRLGKSYTGLLKPGTKKRLARAVTILVQTNPPTRMYNPVSNKWQMHSLSFITLTISDAEKIKDGKWCYVNLLAPMLQWLRRNKGMKEYIWKAERQKNGQLHYHITTPIFCHHSDIRNQWNYLQKKHNLVDNFKMKYGNENPNSTDIHSVRNVPNLAGYLIKHIIKSYQNEKSIGGKVWDCSDNLRGVKYFNLPLDDSMSETFLEYEKQQMVEKIVGEQFMLLRFDHQPHDFFLNQAEKRLYINWIKSVKDKANEQE